jgi:hypothetical protein
MPDLRVPIKNVGKIAERIVANELEMQGFLVRDLNLEGVAANADLLALRGEQVWQIQVKGSSYDERYPDNGWWFHYGYCRQEHIDCGTANMFNRTKGPLKANAVVLVCVRSASEYKCIFLPLQVAEDAAKINLDYAYRTLRADGGKKKPNIVWMAFYQTNAKTAVVQDGMRCEKELLKPYLLDRTRKETPAEREGSALQLRSLMASVFSLGSSSA